MNSFVLAMALAIFFSDAYAQTNHWMKKLKVKSDMNKTDVINIHGQPETDDNLGLVYKDFVVHMSHGLLQGVSYFRPYAHATFTIKPNVVNCGDHIISERDLDDNLKYVRSIYLSMESNKQDVLKLIDTSGFQYDKKNKTLTMIREVTPNRCLNHITVKLKKSAKGYSDIKMLFYGIWFLVKDKNYKGNDINLFPRSTVFEHFSLDKS